MWNLASSEKDELDLRLPYARSPRWSPTVSAPLMTEGLDGGWGNNKNNNFLSALETCRLKPDLR